MTIGISKEYLESIINEEKYGGLLSKLISKCTELDPWMPIEEAPWGKPIKVFYPTMPEGLRQQIISCRVNWDASLHKPTHYQELPDDPKE